MNAQAQSIAETRFFLNFAAANSADHKISFRTEKNTGGNIDFIVLKAEKQLFCFRGIVANDETPYSFNYVDDKNNALEGLKLRNTLTNYSNFGYEISTAFENKDVVYIGILECTTKDGATSRMQVVRMVQEEDNAGLSLNNN
jgi:hypothetical protein